MNNQRWQFRSKWTAQQDSFSNKWSEFNPKQVQLVHRPGASGVAWCLPAICKFISGGVFFCVRVCVVIVCCLVAGTNLVPHSQAYPAGSVGCCLLWLPTSPVNGYFTSDIRGEFICAILIRILRWLVSILWNCSVTGITDNVCAFFLVFFLRFYCYSLDISWQPKQFFTHHPRHFYQMEWFRSIIIFRADRCENLVDAYSFVKIYLEMLSEILGKCCLILKDSAWFSSIL